MSQSYAIDYISRRRDSVFMRKNLPGGQYVGICLRQWREQHRFEGFNSDRELFNVGWSGIASERTRHRIELSLHRRFHAEGPSA
jgi:hypothetical protein